VNKARIGSPCGWLFLGLLLVSCGKQSSESPDAESQKKLTGTWVLTSGAPNFQSTIIVNPDGGYAAHCRDENSNGSRAFDIQGIYRITNGWLFDTITNETQNTNKSAFPVKATNQIVSLTDSELIINYGTSSEPSNGTFRKKGK